MKSVRVRFAPSPTGMFHIGSARTALFNWLYARHTGGTFVLRIEDTDAARNQPEFIEVIFEGMKWLGLDWDEGPQPGGLTKGDHGPYHQSARRAIYTSYVDRLLADGKAYESDGAVKFRTPKTPITVPDLICGQIQFDRTNEPDLVIQRKDGSPVFHLVNVVDDLEMGITHVIRGEDHLSNTHKHLALIEAFGADAAALRPHPAHPQSERLQDEQARRRRVHSDYMDQGYLPAAVRNYLCLLGWSPKDNREILPSRKSSRSSTSRRSTAPTRASMPTSFSGSTASTSVPPRSRPLEPLAISILQRHGILDQEYDPAYFRAALAIVKEKIKLGRELPEWMSYFFREDFPYDETAARKNFTPGGSGDISPSCASGCRELDPPAFNAAGFEKSSLRRWPPSPR